MTEHKCETPDKCLIQAGDAITTLAYYAPIYDGHGRNVNPDRNTTTSHMKCWTCKKEWVEQSTQPQVESAVEPAQQPVKPKSHHARGVEICRENYELYIAKRRYYPPPRPAKPAKPPGMAVQALAGEIVAALLADEKDGGYDLTAGMFGPAFSALVKRWAAAEWNSPPAEPAKQPTIQHLPADDTEGGAL